MTSEIITEEEKEFGYSKKKSYKNTSKKDKEIDEAYERAKIRKRKEKIIIWISIALIISMAAAYFLLG
jgi:hypothetical protein